MNVALGLLKKYNVQGPRYTSYPPAPSWKSNKTTQDYEHLIRQGNNLGSPPPLSIYVHLPFCHSLCYFCACHTMIIGNNKKIESSYLHALHKEIEWVGKRIEKKRPIVQFHLGGGSPSYHSPETLKELIAAFTRHFTFDKEAEISIEIDPRTTTRKHISVLKEIGFNRLSMGIQDFNPDIQKRINRIQPFEMTKDIMDAGRENGFKSINLDLVYGLPHQTPETFQKTIAQILSLQPDRLAVYSFAHVPWLKKHQSLLTPHLPSEKEKFAIFTLALEEFTKAGFEYIGMDHFAKPNDELTLARKNRTLWRNFMGYTTKAGTDLLGLGMSAIGSLQGSFLQNEKDLGPYEDMAKSNGTATVRGFTLSQEDKIRSRVIQNLLCHGVLVKKEIEEEFDIQFDSHFEEELYKCQPLVQDGLLKIDSDHIQPTSLGRIFLRNIAMPFDQYLPKPGEKKIFSRTV